MRFGVCCSLENAAAAIGAGFDYVEIPAGPTFSGSIEPDYARLKSFPVEAGNQFVAGDLKLVGPERGDVRGYTELVAERAAKAGIKVLVIGSGTARRSPAGYDLDSAEDDFYRSVKMIAEVCRAHGIVAAPESLVPAETNVGNYSGDLARMLAHQGIGYTADTYHILNQPGAMPEIAGYWDAEVPSAPEHVHVATTQRTWRVAEDPMLAGFVKRLQDLNYTGRVSLECRWQNIEEELPLALEQVRQLFNRGS
jgi:sugar phosphate isomerase/epimerase